MSFIESEKHSNSELVSMAEKGDVAAYGCLYDRYMDQIFRYIYFRVNNQQETEDMVEIVFLKTFEQIKHQQLKIEKFKSWLYRTANNLVTDHYRTRKIPVSFEEVILSASSESLPESVVQDREIHLQLRTVIEMLEPDMQQVIVCRFVNGLSHEETAQIIGIKANYLRVLQYRALQKLRKLLKENGNHG
jgi:RNA polymerase sigma-70 factor, ECF subfamily